MHPSFTTTYVLPMIFLNPVLFLHTVNTILSRLLPPIVAAATVQPAPYSPLGPSGSYPHIDMHASDNLCWSYTAVMVCAQLVAYGKVSQSREERKERRDRRRLEKEAQISMETAAQHGGEEKASGDLRMGNGKANGDLRGGTGTVMRVIDGNGKPASFIREDSQSTEGTDEEIIL